MVTQVTDPSSRSFRHSSQRIAVFDNDGTLWAERPYYFQLYFAVHRIKRMAAKHPEWRQQQPFKEALADDFAGIMKTGGKGLTALFETAFGGLSVDEFAAETREWLRTARHPTLKKRFTQLTYQPMLELLQFLRANGFKTYIVSGGDSEFMRAWAPRTYGIAPEQVLGSYLKSKLITRDGKLILFREQKFELFNNAAQKAILIQKILGRRPVIAVGNSDGDLQMLQWTKSGNGRRLAMLIHHTDAKREWAYDRGSAIGRLDKALDAARKNRWIVVNMMRDWRTIFPHHKP